MLLLAAITLSLNLDQIHAPENAQQQAPRTGTNATCGIKTVSYRFVGEPGTEFRYAGDTYRVPVRGTIELIAERGVTDYQVASRKLLLDVWPRDEMGTRTIPLPKRDAIQEMQQGGAR